MKKFLETVLDDLKYPGTQNEPYVFVLPSKRAGFFLKQYIASRTTTAMLMPEIWSIEEFITSLSGLKLLPQSELLFKLYDCYSKLQKDKAQSFPEFNKWGITLLEDFNEIDRYLVDPAAIFPYLANIHEIRGWELNQAPSKMMQYRLDFWKSLLPVYEAFSQILSEDNSAYQGLSYRRALEQLNAQLEHYASKVIFIGFNALNKAEDTIIQGFLNAGKAEIYWDIDPYYLESTYHDAGFFIRKYLKEWPYFHKHKPKVLNSGIGMPDKVKVYACSGNISQVKWAGKLIEDIAEHHPENLENTALILSEESLLDQMIPSLPANLTAVNITMGQVINSHPNFAFFLALIELHESRSARGWYHRMVRELTDHPLASLWLEKNSVPRDVFRSAIIAGNWVYLSEEKIQKLNLPDSLRKLLFPKEIQNGQQLCRLILSLILEIKTIFRALEDYQSLENIYYIYQLFQQIERLQTKYTFAGEIATLKSLFTQLAPLYRTDFQGDPLSGLQLMGMLESRNLDFHTVILTSVNEGILPAGNSANSFIPFDVKREFDMPTYKEKDAIFTYHFYRLLQRAQNVHLLYNTQKDVLEGGEKSRLITQLLTDSRFRGSITESIVSPKVGLDPIEQEKVSKSPSLVRALRNRMEKGISPTLLTRYLSDPLLFYRRDVLGIPEPEQWENAVTPRIMGIVIHETLEMLLQPCLNTILNPESLKASALKIPEVVGNLFELHVLKGSKLEGKNTIAQEVIVSYLQNYFKTEIQLAKRHEIRPIGLEAKLTCPIVLEDGSTVMLKGTVDRIDLVDGQLRILDYKTGAVDPTELSVKSWEELFTNEKKSKALQLLCYALLYSENNPDSQISAGIYSFKKHSNGIMQLKFKGDALPDPLLSMNALEPFKKHLVSLITQILNPEVPLAANNN